MRFLVFNVQKALSTAGNVGQLHVAGHGMRRLALTFHVGVKRQTANSQTSSA